MYRHVRNLCINHRCISNIGMLNQPFGKHSCLRYSTYVSLQMHKLCIDNANSEAIRTDKLIMYMICTLIYCSSLKTPRILSHIHCTNNYKSQVIWYNDYISSQFRESPVVHSSDCRQPFSYFNKENFRSIHSK